MSIVENNELLQAKELLSCGDITCAVICGDYRFTSAQRGVKPLLELLEKQSIVGGSAADKVVGKAAAYLYVLLGVRAIYANVISELALKVLKKYQIEVSYSELVPMIRNRSNTGYCPMEQATASVDDPNEALEAIKSTLRALK